jgi:hypothetical protein
MMLGTKINGRSHIVGNTFETGPGTQAPLSTVFESLYASDNVGDIPNSWKVKTAIATSLERSSARVRMHGTVRPARPGRVVVTYYRVVEGTARRLGGTSVPLTTDGQYSASFRRPQPPGACRATVELAGVGASIPGKTLNFSC